MAIIQQLCLKLVEEKNIYIFSKIKWNTPILLVSGMVTLKPLFESLAIWTPYFGLKHKSLFEVILDPFSWKVIAKNVNVNDCLVFFWDTKLCL